MSDAEVAVLVTLIALVILIVLIFFIWKTIVVQQRSELETSKRDIERLQHHYTEVEAELKHQKSESELIAQNLAHDTIRTETQRVRQEERQRAHAREARLRKDLANEKQAALTRSRQVWEAEQKNRSRELVAQTRKDTSDRSRAVLKGRISEQLAPLLAEFAAKYSLADARFVGNPIDYVIFQNLTQYKDEMKRKVPVEERCQLSVVIADIKTGSLGLNTEQRRIRDVIRAGRVAWDEIRVDV